MPQKDYASYARSPQGKAARERAHQRYIERRRVLREMNRSTPINPTPLAQVVSSWRKP